MNSDDKEKTNEQEDELKKLNDEKDKYIFKGFAYGVVVTLLMIFAFNIRFIISPLPNSRKVMNKLNEMNYIIDRFNMYEKDNEYIGDMISLGMMAGLKDKYANYYTKKDLEKIKEEIVGEYVGIGVIVLEDVEDGYFTIVKVYPNSPAEKAGLRVLDKIKLVGETDVSALEADEVVALVRGVENTKVSITVFREKTNETLTYEVIRMSIDTPMITEEFDSNNILHITIDSFEGKAYEQICEIRDKYEEKGIKGIIIDVRNCPGGNLKVLLKISDLFLDESVITYFEDKDGKRQYYKAEDGSWNVPIAILTNEYTASAAEAFTAALQENGMAKVFGTVTYGKGVVQEVFSLSDGTAIKFTVSKYFTPKGNEVNEKGITPDVEVLNDDNNTDKQYNAAHDYIMEQVQNN